MSTLPHRGRGRAVPRLCSAVLGALLLATPAFAQTNAYGNAGIQFDFPLPGARSLGLGGAFVAVADDATASQSNPAGLTQLVRPEVSVEGRTWRFSNLVVARGHAFGPPTGVGVDTIPDLVDEAYPDTTAGLSFLSVAIPRGRFAFGFFRHEQARYEANIQSDGPFLTATGFEDRVEPFRGTMDLRIVNYGGSAAYSWPSGVAVGATLAFSDFSIDATTKAFADPPPIFLIQPPSDRVRYTGLGQAYGPANFADNNLLLDVTEAGSDQGVGVNAGILIKPPAARWSAGASVRIGPEFSYDARAVLGPAHRPESEIGTVIDEETVPFKVPDVYSVGATFRPKEALLVAVQYDRVQFSQMSDDIQEVFGIDQSNPPVEPILRSGLRFPDSNQIRGGVEYAMVRGERTIALRFGTAYETEHRMRFEHPNLPCGAVNNPCLERAQVLFRPGEDQFHAMPGIGLVFPKIQFDAAVDFSERTQTVSFSLVYRF